MSSGAEPSLGCHGTLGGGLLGGLVLDIRPRTVLPVGGTEVVLGQHPPLPLRAGGCHHGAMLRGSSGKHR